MAGMIPTPGGLLQRLGVDSSGRHRRGTAAQPLAEPRSLADPHRWTYWSREPLAYQSGLPRAYAGSGITAPACLGVHVGATQGGAVAGVGRWQAG
jgi:hypothetical protein